jgi:hypothetical protein
VYVPDDGVLKAETCSKALLEITNVFHCCVVTVFNKEICQEHGSNREWFPIPLPD